MNHGERFKEITEALYECASRSQKLIGDVNDEKFSTSWLLQNAKELDNDVTTLLGQLVNWIEEIWITTYTPIKTQSIKKADKAVLRLIFLNEEISKLDNQLLKLREGLKFQNIEKSSECEYTQQKIQQTETELSFYQLERVSTETLIETLKLSNEIIEGFHEIEMNLASTLVKESNLVFKPKKERLKRHFAEAGKNLLTDAIPYSGTLRKIFELVSGFDIEDETWGKWNEKKKRQICLELLNDISFRMQLIPDLVSLKLKSITELVRMSKTYPSIE